MPYLETVGGGDSIRGSLDCESGILMLNYTSPFDQCAYLSMSVFTGKWD